MSVSLVAAGALLAWSHFPRYGAAAGVMLGVASWQHLRRGGREALASS